MLRFEIGAMFANTAARDVDVDVRNARVLMLRMSDNWDDNGDWADARLKAKAQH